MPLKTLTITLLLLPLVASLLAGLFGEAIGRRGAHRITIACVGLALLLACVLAWQLWTGRIAPVNLPLYTWLASSLFQYDFSLGVMLDPLSVVMMVVVLFVSFLVHLYSIGYMADDAGYQRFFSYISLFTFAMLMLVTSNNFLQLFFGWEGVGLVSYLLIGFWYTKESAVQAGLKAFLVNRIGDFGFILGMGVLFVTTGSLFYPTVFAKAPVLAQQTWALTANFSVNTLTLACLLLFVGAMGKSAQMPLHVWLPESMEGPTPISALIHAATMVTAGVFMLARLSPLFEHSATALNVVLVIGATGALFTGLVAIVMNDIKRVVAYSTLSQLGYMMVAMGASAYAVGMFHLVTHAFFKALLFLGAGSVIIAMHHEQDMQKMGGLWRYLPITYLTFVIGTLALVALPPFAGFYSKDSIIEAAHLSTLPGATYAYYCVLIGAFVTAVYSFRALFLTFHGKPRMSAEARQHLHESPWVVWLPLVALAIPATVSGWLLIEPMLYAKPGLLGQAITVLPEHSVMGRLAEEFHGPWAMLLHAPKTSSFWLVIAGFGVALLNYILIPSLPSKLSQRCQWIYRVLLNKYGFDTLNDWVFVRGTRRLASVFATLGDKRLIDGYMVNGSGQTVQWLANHGRLLQTGYLFHYASAMVLGMIGLLIWFIW